MPKKTGYTQVDRALEELDRAELSRRGKKGAASKKQKGVYKLYILLRGAEQTAHEAHLDVCPIPD